MSSHAEPFHPDAAEAIALEVERLTAGPGIHTLGVCGLGGTGKTSACREVMRRSDGRAVLFETDWFLAESSAARKQKILAALDSSDEATLAKWADPSAWYNWRALLRGIAVLRSTGFLDIRSAWRQTTGEKDLVATLAVPQGRSSVIVVDGIYLLHEAIRSELDRVVLLESDIAATLRRTETRDSHRSESKYLEFKARLTESFDVPYFDRLRQQADVIVNLPAELR